VIKRFSVSCQRRRRENTSLTSRGSQVRSLSRPPHLLPVWPGGFPPSSFDPPARDSCSDDANSRLRLLYAASSSTRGLSEPNASSMAALACFTTLSAGSPCGCTRGSFDATGVKQPVSRKPQAIEILLTWKRNPPAYPQDEVDCFRRATTRCKHHAGHKRGGRYG
jgi:hypothetical protein